MCCSVYSFIIQLLTVYSENLNAIQLILYTDWIKSENQLYLELSIPGSEMQGETKYIVKVS